MYNYCSVSETDQDYGKEIWSVHSSIDPYKISQICQKLYFSENASKVKNILKIHLFAFVCNENIWHYTLHCQSLISFLHILLNKKLPLFVFTDSSSMLCVLPSEFLICPTAGSSHCIIWIDPNFLQEIYSSYIAITESDHGIRHSSLYKYIFLECATG
jgi:hypothetical protein